MNKVIKAIIAVGILAVIGAGVMFGPKLIGALGIGGSKMANISTSQLEKAIEISDLSTAEFTYNGVAQIYKDEEKKHVKCNIVYDSKVKVGVDMSKLKFEIDPENKTVKPIIPELEIRKPVIDTKTIDFLPKDVNEDLKNIIAACENDALEEAEKTPELKKAAQENVQTTIEALLCPVLDSEDYKIIWN